jgi:outer membrane protein assembly factor BamD (BamD/ComL family)
MKTRITAVLILCTFILCLGGMSACSENRAEELFKTAEFEELQNNREHALQLYEEILKQYPESSFAEKARVRKDAISAADQAR